MLSSQVNFSADRQTDKQTDRKTPVKQYVLNLSMQGHKKWHNSQKMHFELSLLKLWIALWIVNTYSKFQVNTFSNNRDIHNV